VAQQQLYLSAGVLEVGEGRFAVLAPGQQAPCDHGGLARRSARLEVGELLGQRGGVGHLTRLAEDRLVRLLSRVKKLGELGPAHAQELALLWLARALLDLFVGHVFHPVYGRFRLVDCRRIP
jgi:hypothetical protein